MAPHHHHHHHHHHHSIIISLNLLLTSCLLLLTSPLFLGPDGAAAGTIRPFPFNPAAGSSSSRKPSSSSSDDPNDRMLVLVPTPSPALTYHGGPLLTARSLRLHILWYGAFSAAQKAAVADFVSSFTTGPRASPSVLSWWRVARRYTDSAKLGAAAAFKLGAVASDPTCQLLLGKKKQLTDSDLAALVSKAIAARYLPGPKPAALGSAAVSDVYVVFTAADVLVEDFCMNSCGTHSTAAVNANANANAAKVPFVWVGNPATQCPGLCAWPYAVPQYGPPGPALSPPNGEPATDGMIVNLALLLAGTVTNPFDTGYFQGDAGAPLEAGSACQGVFGKGSYPGYPGELLQDKESGASYNALGANNRRFLLPALWNPATGTCVAPI